MKGLYKRVLSCHPIGACPIHKGTLKGVFTKNKSGYSLLILLLSVAYIRRKLLKTTHTEVRSVQTNAETL